MYSGLVVPTITVSNDGMNQHSQFLLELTLCLEGDVFWAPYLADHIVRDAPNKNLHVAIFRQPYLQWVFDGKKTVESRFSKNEIVPFRNVHEGDVVLLKEVGGPVIGISRANAAWSYKLDKETREFIRQNYAEPICAFDDSFWIERQEANFATLVELGEVRKLDPIPYPKSDRRGWVIEKERQVQMVLEL